MPLDYFVVDAFAAQPFHGNPATVVLLEAWLEEGKLQNIAMEMNVSETAFLVRHDLEYALRWFTPSIEVESESKCRSLATAFYS